jgi:GrpB-like predicted nucleotidyltransferase (UPF0157 family)
MSHETEDSDPASGATDERLDEITVGERRLHNSTIDLVSYDPAWPSQFARLAARIHAALADRVLRLEHVGSTSIPGLAAKPIIDAVLAVADAADEAAYVTSLEHIGCVLRIREPDWFEHRLLKTPEIDGNLHVFSAGCSEIDRMVAFRDWLRTHDDDRLLYERTKRDLAVRTWRHVQNYADAKSDVVAEIMSRALGARGDSSGSVE